MTRELTWRAEDLRSFTQYRAFMVQLADATSDAQALRFFSWVLTRFPSVFGESIWDGLTPRESERLREMVRRLNESATLGEVIGPELAVALQRELEALGPKDDVGRIEVHPDATEFQSAVWTFLEYCRTRDRRQLCTMSEHLINSWDHRLDSGSYALDNMFTCPELRTEVVLHQALLSIEPPGSPSLILIRSRIDDAPPNKALQQTGLSVAVAPSGARS